MGGERWEENHFDAQKEIKSTINLWEALSHLFQCRRCYLCKTISISRHCCEKWLMKCDIWEKRYYLPLDLKDRQFFPLPLLFYFHSIKLNWSANYKFLPSKSNWKFFFVVTLFICPTQWYNPLSLSLGSFIVSPSLGSNVQREFSPFSGIYQLNIKMFYD